MSTKAKRNLFLSLIMIVLALILFVIFKPVSDDTKKDLIRKAIATGIVEGKLPRYSQLGNKENIVVSSENIDQELLPVISNMKFTVLRPAKIKEMGKVEVNFLYLDFSEIYFNGFFATMKLELKWANIASIPGEGGSITVKFYNIAGKWIQKESKELWIE